jgi:hypothetical protein
MRLRTPRALFLVAALALLSVGAALGEESFVHTDDGCAVEVHCLACRLAVGSTAALVLGVPAPIGLQLAGNVCVAPVLPAQDSAVAPQRSRAPPLA